MHLAIRRPDRSVSVLPESSFSDTIRGQNIMNSKHLYALIIWDYCHVGSDFLGPKRDFSWAHVSHHALQSSRVIPVERRENNELGGFRFGHFPNAAGMID